MSKRSRRPAYQRGHFAAPRDVSHEAQILNAPAVDMLGDPVVKALMNRLSTCSEVEAVNIGLALQKLIRGDAALLSHTDDPGVAETVAKLQEARAKQDEAAEAYEADQTRFTEEVLSRAEKITPVGANKDKVIANAMQQYTEAQQIARANQATQTLRLTQQLSRGPKVIVDVEPVFETRKIDGQPQIVQIPLEIRIMNKRFLLKPGTQELPKVVADRVKQIQATRHENAARRKVMASNVNAPLMEQQLAALDKQYGTVSDHLNIPEEV